MKTKITSLIVITLLSLGIALSTETLAQTNIQTFWKNFKSAIEKGDKNAVAEMTKFPLEMPYGIKSVKTKGEFIKRYNEIFKDEADAAKCFPKTTLDKENSKRYAVYCSFKENIDKPEDAPFKYYFESTKNGWKFTGFDNINE